MKEHPLVVKRYNLLVEFCNLHLTSGYVRTEEKNRKPQYPKEKEQQRLIDFFSKYEPAITRNMNAKEAYLDGKKIYQTDNRRYIEADRCMARNIGSLGGYELDRIWGKTAPICEKYSASGGSVRVDDILEHIEKYAEGQISWFQSDDFFEFSKEYHNVALLIDSYITRGKAPFKSLRWLNESIGRYKRQLSVIEPSTGYAHHIGDFFHSSDRRFWDRFSKEEGIDVNDYDFTMDYFYADSPKMMYGICLNRIMFQIHTGLVWVLQLKPRLQYCSFDVGKRNPFCKNVFIPSREGQKFCREECRLKYHNIEKAAYMRRKRDPESPDYDPKYALWRK